MFNNLCKSLQKLNLHSFMVSLNAIMEFLSIWSSEAILSDSSKVKHILGSDWKGMASSCWLCSTLSSSRFRGCSHSGGSSSRTSSRLPTRNGPECSIYDHFQQTNVILAGHKSTLAVPWRMAVIVILLNRTLPNLTFPNKS